jgi:Domain of unknown function (DUF397)
MSSTSISLVHELNIQDARNIPVAGWRRSSFCYSGECVEVAAADGVIFVRDSKHPDDAVQRYASQEWRSFVRAVKSGALDDLS